MICHQKSPRFPQISIKCESCSKDGIQGGFPCDCHYATTNIRIRLRALIATIMSSLKWKLVNFTALDTWVRGSTALLGDACHPTLPYQAQGAAMAVEDGACVAKLLGLASRSHAAVDIPCVLQLYERLRKDRTTLNVEGATSNRAVYHASGKVAQERDKILEGFDWDDPEARSPFKGFNE